MALPSKVRLLYRALFQKSGLGNVSATFGRAASSCTMAAELFQYDPEVNVPRRQFPEIDLKE